MRDNRLTDAIRGFPILIKFEYSTDLDDGICNLAMELSESKDNTARVVRVEFRGIANLNIREFGGGITQLLLLTIDDINDEQLDRIHYRVQDLERDSIYFLCQSVSIQDAFA